jgi:hypothetical protein
MKKNSTHPKWIQACLVSVKSLWASGNLDDVKLA